MDKVVKQPIYSDPGGIKANSTGDRKKKQKGNVAAGAKATEETLRLKETTGSLARQAIPAIDGNQIMQLHPMPMAIVDSHYALIDANPAYENLMQQSLEKLKKMESTDYKIRFVSGEKTDLTFSEKRMTKCELELTFKDGHKNIVEQYGVPLPDSTGAITQAFFVYNDITRQREEEAELQKQMGKIGNLQKRSETIVQQNPMPILLLTTDFKIIVTNEAYIAMSGFTREQLLAMSARDFKVLEQKGEGLKHVIQNKKRSFGEVTVELPKGVRILEQHGIPIVNDKGDLINLMIVYNDITEKRERDREIQRLMDESRQRAEALTASAHDVEIAMAAVAKGDLATLMQIDAADPLKKVKSDFNASIASIRGLLEEVQKAVKQVENTTIDVSRSTKEIGKATEQVATSTQHSSDYARKQLEQIEAVGREVSDLSASIEEIASTSHEVMERAQSASKEGAQAATLGNQANTKMQAVERIAKQSVDEITKLNDQMREISTIVKLITDIANQTNLLALNAAIEAARAGEHGRGFAVVAGEVRNLAGESKKATQHIEEVIGGVTTSSARTAESMKSAYSEIAAGMESVTKTIEALNNILDGIGVVAQGVTEISKATEDQANATNRVMERMEQATQITKENQKQIEDVAALSEEVSASTEEVNAGSEELSAMAGHLKQTVDRFKLA